MPTHFRVPQGTQIKSGSRHGTAYDTILRYTIISLFLAFIAAFLPQPSNPVVRAIMSPFLFVILSLKSILLFIAPMCFSFGEGIAEPRPPAPIGMKSMPIRGIQLSDRSRTDQASSDALLVDAECEDYDTDEENSATNPFKKRT